MKNATKYTPFDIVEDGITYRWSGSPQAFVEYLEGKMTVKLLKETREYCERQIEYWAPKGGESDYLWVLTGINKVLDN